MRKVDVEPWTTEWVMKYEAEAAMLRSIFTDQLLGIHHIGSTSVSAIGYAKPIIDILLLVRQIQDVPLYYESLRLAGYEPRGENGIAGREYFVKGHDQRTHHLHVYEPSHLQAVQHLLFRDYLIHHPLNARQYGELKRQLAALYPSDPAAYQQAKADHCQSIMNNAQQWKDMNPGG
ncbi:GrpB family protein [Paenibacillus bovis]|uniref:GrpB family protein n=1 Tax=Paenibacillus bovis TaxID=1616788 RepID=A0A172ZH18_9BACL|nr:GrpB family protein [Paenibacillus bovis]ANF96702.1 hypothetical protein AR543_12245 [Paenibacillus bovis]